MTRTESSLRKLKSYSWKTFPLDDKEWPLKKESLTKTECSWFFNSPEEPFDRCVFQDLSENPILLRAPVAQLDRATDSGLVISANSQLIQLFVGRICWCAKTVQRASISPNTWLLSSLAVFWRWLGWFFLKKSYLVLFLVFACFSANLNCAHNLSSTSVLACLPVLFK